MVARQENGNRVSPLELVRAKALSNLDGYLASPREELLREHQISTLGFVRDFLADGNTAGYISLPTGSGKTVVATELIKALGLNTIVASPTRQISAQTETAAALFIPDIKVTNYHGGKKDVAGSVVNATYQSLPGLAAVPAVSEGAELVILDEVHTALGEQRHALLRKFPNALLVGLTATPAFEQLEGYRRRGLVKEGERWTGVFENKIHEMGIEEAIEREILSPLDVTLIKSDATVGRVRVSGKGQYNETDIQRYLRTEARNLLALGMVAGIDTLDAAKIPFKQLEAIHDIHQSIKGKRTVIFGLSIDHIKDLEQRLRDSGVRAAAIHGHMDRNAIDNILLLHKQGSIPVILGVDLLRLGWDSPETEVGIYLGPTKSGVVAVQELGRILRRSPATGKERATAIQVVDQYEMPSQAPVLIPDIFNPSYVVRGSELGKSLGEQKTINPKERPAITFGGMEIDAVVEKARSEELIQSRFKNATLEEMDAMVQTILTDIQQGTYAPHQPAIDLYKRIADVFSERVSFQEQQTALNAATSSDDEDQKIGKRLFLFLNMKTVFSAIEPYLGENVHENNELIQEALVSVSGGLHVDMIHANTPIAQQVYTLAKRGVATFISAQEDVSRPWVLDKHYGAIKQRIDELHKHAFVLTGTQIDDLAGELAEETGIERDKLQAYIASQAPVNVRSLHPDNAPQPLREGEVFQAVEPGLRAEAIDEVLDTLAEREAGMLKLRYGITDGEPKTNDEVGQVYGVTRERVRQIESKALGKLRHPHRARKLFQYVEGLGEDSY